MLAVSKGTWTNACHCRWGANRFDATMTECIRSNVQQPFIESNIRKQLAVQKGLNSNGLHTLWKGNLSQIDAFAKTRYPQHLDPFPKFQLCQRIAPSEGGI